MVALVGMAAFWAIPFALVGGAIAWLIAPADVLGGALLLGAAGALYGWVRGRRRLEEEDAMRARAAIAGRMMAERMAPRSPDPRPAPPAPSRQQVDDLMRRFDREAPTDEVFDELFDLAGVRQGSAPSASRPGPPPPPPVPSRMPRDQDPALALDRTAGILDKRGAADPELLRMLMERHGLAEPRSARRVARRLVFQRLPPDEVQRLFPAGARFPELTDQERAALVAERRSDPGVAAWSIGAPIRGRPLPGAGPGAAPGTDDTVRG